jgi:hypothetical protein
MILEDLSRGERSKLHVAMIDALDVPAKRSINIREVQRQALCEAICWADHPGDVFLLADQIDAFLYAALLDANAEHADIDAEELRQIVGSQTVNLALKLAGIVPVERGRCVVWTTATSDEHSISISLPVDLLEHENRP